MYYIQPSELPTSLLRSHSDLGASVHPLSMMPCSLGTDDLYIHYLPVSFTILFSLMRSSLIPYDVLQPSGLPTAPHSSLLLSCVRLGPLARPLSMMPCSLQLGTDDLYIYRSQVQFTFLLSLMQFSLTAIYYSLQDYLPLPLRPFCSPASTSVLWHARS